MKQPQPLPPKNLTIQEKHAIQERLRLNAQQVKEQEQINRERKMQDEMEASKNANRMAKSKAQYSHVQSKVAPFTGASQNFYEQQQGNNNNELPSYSQQEDDVEITVYVRETEPDGGVQRMMESQLLRMNGEQQRQYDQNAFAGAGRVGAAGRNNSMPSQQRSTSQNAKLLQQQRVPLQQQQQPSVAAIINNNKPSAPAGHGKLGNVPDYLLQRKAQLQAEKDAAARAIEEEREKAKNPPGHRAVSEEERQAVLARLEARKLELERDLAKLPMRFDTIAVRNRRTEIEKEMSEVEEAHRRFSVRKQLFVPI
jgi:hypothetical protein